MKVLPYIQIPGTGKTKAELRDSVPQRAACKAQFADYSRDQLLAAQPGLQRLYQVQAHLQSDLLACDARWSLFVAAVTSYKFESLVLPFPKEFLNEQQRPNINKVYDIIGDVPRLEVVEQRLLHCNYGPCRPDVMKLLHSVLVKHGERVALNSLSQCQFESLFAYLRVAPPRQMPSQILEVTPSPKSAHTKAYARLCRQHPVKLAYYGGKLEHFYGLLTADRLPEGKPLVLTSDVNEALKRSPPGAGWGGSRCGSLLRCVAIVELVCAPKYVVLEADEQGVRDGRRVLVNNASCIQISYILIYGQSCRQFEAQKPCRQLLNWAEANKYAISLGVYLMILSFTSSCGRGFFRSFARTSLNVFKRGLLRM
ncbi:protein mono-ADP-ribosyltransferase PARP16 [Scaptodrosophila lebanonensis]|uniref:Protein mono-ADP-ribosyltransferase PARP16 n=1 Tax=Drosophila lebanonensis TaxID=7225 RepID=A0A6J2UF23_DROLE|nr:protein mono-ADP-ribosyltransferase PARP16 [Scaptodrosophila lebanonensis]